MWANPLTVFGSMSIPLFISNLLTVLGFIAATYFSLTYTKTFYEGRPIQKSWLLIVSGLAVLVISEISQFMLPYRIEPLLTTILLNALSISVQSIGIFMVAIGCYFLYKEVS